MRVLKTLAVAFDSGPALPCVQQPGIWCNPIPTLKDVMVTYGCSVKRETCQSERAACVPIEDIRPGATPPDRADANR